MVLLDSSKYTKAQLDAIVTAFADLADGLQPHDYADETGDHSAEAELNFCVAKSAIYPDTAPL
jgi:hypothetical protein